MSPNVRAGIPARSTVVLDAAYRAVYRLGFRLARLWWGLRQPEHHGAMVAVWLEGRILLLRSSYRDSFDFPGGGIARGEAARAAACRELFEEVGIAAAAEALTFVREIVARWDNRLDHVSMFELTLATPPRLRVDRREIIAASFIAPATALSLPISPFVRAYLEGAAVS